MRWPASSVKCPSYSHKCSTVFGKPEIGTFSHLTGLFSIIGRKRGFPQTIGLKESRIHLADTTHQTITVSQTPDFGLPRSGLYGGKHSPWKIKYVRYSLESLQKARQFYGQFSKWLCRSANSVLKSVTGHLGLKCANFSLDQEFYSSVVGDGVTLKKYLLSPIILLCHNKNPSFKRSLSPIKYYKVRQMENALGWKWFAP